MPTINQLVRKGRQAKVEKSKSPALQKGFNALKRESTSISGGEKTLAAITFLLALQTLKPSPFYLLDEVDAHLDALNTERLSKILEERSRGSQIIMVSLKDATVQKASLIYGVFPKNGVSQLVSHKISNVQQVAN